MGVATDQAGGLAVIPACGRIVAESGKLVAVQRRWLPYWGSQLQALWDHYWPRGVPDRCELYYHRPLGSPNFLTLSYIRSSRSTRCNTVFVALLALDDLARRLNVNAVVCNVTNRRISDRLMAKLGWSRHCLHWRGRHFIKRFYGNYPAIAPHWRQKLTAENN